MNKDFIEIISAAKSGDERAFEALYNMTKDSAYFIALSITKNEHDALDILQESYIKAFENLSTVDPPETFDNWLNKIVSNKSKDWLKKKKPILFADIEMDIPKEWNEEELNKDYIPHESVDSSETSRLVMEIINNLPEDKRLTVLMYYYQGMSVAEISETLEIPVTTVKYKLLSARQEIKKAIEDLEKKGIKLYSVAPLAILSGALVYSAGASASSVPVYTAVSVSAAIGGSASVAGGVTAGTAVHGGFFATAAGKITVIAASAAVAVGGTITAVVISGNHSESAPERRMTSEETAENFIYSLAVNKFDESLSAMYLPDTALVTSEDIQQCLPRTSFRSVSDINFDGNKMEIKAESQDYQNDTETVMTVNVVIKDKENGFVIDNFKVSVYLNNDNYWAVDGSEFYYTDYQFYTPGGETKVSINGRELGDEFIANKYYGTYSCYTLYDVPYIAKKEVRINIKNDSMDYSENVLPLSDDKLDEEDMIFMDESDNEEYFNVVMDIWNSLYKLYASGNGSSAALEYISSDADPRVAEIIWRCFDSISGDNNFDFSLSKCLKNEEKPTFRITESRIFVNFRYELSWHYSKSLNWEQNTRRYSNIILVVENGKYKIDSLTEIGLFTSANNFTHDW